jgi:hypothetical protein
MVGAVLIVIAVVIVGPISFMMLGVLISAAFGYVLKRNAEETHEGSELLETNY